MVLDYIYVHLDSVSNSVLSSGVTIHDFSRSILHRPSNLLFLDPNSSVGEFELHTGLKMIRGEENVQNYLATESRNSTTKWIDFSDLKLLKQLSPLEISELLYLGHMKNNLHSPFFYKLQNNFVFLSMGENTSKVYYRHIEECYRVITEKICQNLMRKLNEKKSFFKKPIRVTPLHSSIIKDLKPYMQDGIAFGFEKISSDKRICEIPIYLVEDKLKKISNTYLRDQESLGSFYYSFDSQTWELKLQEDECLFMELPKQA